MGERAFSKIQWGLEPSSAQGTAVAADTLLLAGTHPPIPPDRVPTMIEDDAGVRALGVRANPRIDQLEVKSSLNFSDAYYQLLPILFSMGIKGGVTPVEQTSGEGDYLWTFTPSMTATNTPDSGTLEVGDDTQAYECEFMQIERLAINGTINQDNTPARVGIDVDFYARQWTPVSFTGGITIPTTTELNAKVTRFYRDTSWAGLGGTEVTGLLRAYTIEILTGLHPKFHGDANKYFDTFGQGKFDVLFNLTLEGNSGADAIYDLFQAGTKSFLQFSLDGPQIGAGDNHNLTLGVGGFWQAVTPLAENSQGNNLHTAILRGSYDITGAQEFALTTKTNVASI